MSRHHRLAGAELPSGAIAASVAAGVMLSLTSCGVNSLSLVGQWEATRVAPSLSPGENFDWPSAQVRFTPDGRWEGTEGGCHGTASGSYTLHSTAFDSDSDSGAVLNEACPVEGVPFASLLGYATKVRLSNSGERAVFLSKRGNTLLVLARAS